VNVIPHNPDPILVCAGAERCGWQPHHFVRSDKIGNGGARQVFGCGRCSAERTFGVVDLRSCGTKGRSSATRDGG